MLDGINHKIDLHRRKRVVLEDLFKTLLHKLMTRKIRVGQLDLAGIDGAVSADLSSHVEGANVRLG